MVEIVKIGESISVTSEATAIKSRLLSKKHVLVETPFTNTAKVYVALSYEYTGAGRRSTDFEPLSAGEIRFYGAPNQKLIHWLRFYSESGTQKVNYFASDGAISRIRGKHQWVKKNNVTSITLVNDTAKTQDVTVPSGKRWRLLWCKQTNPDSVTRNLYAKLYDASDNDLGFIISANAVTSGLEHAFPCRSHAGWDEISAESSEIWLDAGEYIRFTWDKGGTSTGGTDADGLVVVVKEYDA